MFQTIQSHSWLPRTYYVVDLKEFPPPMPIHDGGDPALTQYAEALTAAINDGVVTEAGKYAISINTTLGRWDIFEVIEPELAEAARP